MMNVTMLRNGDVLKAYRDYEDIEKGTRVKVIDIRKMPLMGTSMYALKIKGKDEMAIVSRDLLEDIFVMDKPIVKKETVNIHDLVINAKCDTTEWAFDTLLDTVMDELEKEYDSPNNPNMTGAVALKKMAKVMGDILAQTDRIRKEVKKMPNFNMDINVEVETKEEF